YGWYNLAIGIAALPASLLFGAVWDRWGAGRAFEMGALLALAAAIGIAFVAPGRRRESSSWPGGDLHLPWYPRHHECAASLYRYVRLGRLLRLRVLPVVKPAHPRLPERALYPRGVCCGRH